MGLKESIREIGEKLGIKSCPLPQAVKSLYIDLTLTEAEKGKIKTYIEYEQIIEGFWGKYNKDIEGEISKMQSIYEKSQKEVELDIYNIIMKKLNIYASSKNIDAKKIDRIKGGFGTSLEFTLYLYYMLKVYSHVHGIKINDYYKTSRKILSELAFTNLYEIDVIVYTLINNKSSKGLSIKELQESKGIFDYKIFELNDNQELKLTNESEKLLKDNLSNMKGLNIISLGCPALYAKGPNKGSGVVLMDLARILGSYFDKQKIILNK